jgi:ribulose-5-phosphate 4-epimerase/fuculose-1-phosphate aldolase
MKIPHAFITLARERADGPVSYTTDSSLYISAAGTTPARIGDDRFLEIPLTTLDEAAAHDDPVEHLVSHRPAGSDLLPPGVETVIHAAITAPFVIHTRPVGITGLLAGADGKTHARKLFGSDIVWIDAMPPNGSLLQAVQQALVTHRDSHGGTDPQFVFLQNHGLLITGDTPEEIETRFDTVSHTLEPVVQRSPELEPTRQDSDALGELNDAVRRALADTRAAHGAALNTPETTACVNPEILRRAASAEAFEPIRRTLMADQLGILGSALCFVPRHGNLTSPQALLADVLHAIHDYYHDEYGAPRVVVVQNAGAVVVGETDEELAHACAAFRRALETACYAESFGGSSAVPEEYIEALRR